MALRHSPLKKVLRTVEPGEAAHQRNREMSRDVEPAMRAQTGISTVYWRGSTLSSGTYSRLVMPAIMLVASVVTAAGGGLIAAYAIDPNSGTLLLAAAFLITGIAILTFGWSSLARRYRN